MFLSLFILIASSFGEYFTVGFIFSIMEVPFNDSLPWTASHLVTHIQKLDEASKANLPIFFLDEVLSHLDIRDSVEFSDATAKLRFARNFLRGVGLVCVLMGTNSSTANIIYAASGIEDLNRNGVISLLPHPNETSRDRLMPMI
jgi:hypothetical protein